MHKDIDNIKESQERSVQKQIFYDAHFIRANFNHKTHNVCRVLECFHKVYYFYDTYIYDKYKIKACKEIIYVFF